MHSPLLARGRRLHRSITFLPSGRRDLSTHLSIMYTQSSLEMQGFFYKYNKKKLKGCMYIYYLLSNNLYFCIFVIVLQYGDLTLTGLKTQNYHLLFLHMIYIINNEKLTRNRIVIVIVKECILCHFVFTRKCNCLLN